MLIVARIFVFLFVLPFSLLFFAFVWGLFAPSMFHTYMWHDIPPFVIAWRPPFIFEGYNKVGVSDYFIWPKWSVYALWSGFVAVALLLPAFIACRFVRRERRDRAA